MNFRQYSVPVKYVGIITALLFITIIGARVWAASAMISDDTTIVAFGDSIVRGVGATTGNDFVSVLSARIGHPIVNKGVSGDITRSALNRLDTDVLSLHPRIVIVFLGGNDILQGVPRTEMMNNLRTIIQRIQNTGAKVILLGIHGPIYKLDLESSFRDLAVETGAAYVPNVLQGILGEPRYLSDTVHPNNAGHQLIADRVFPVLQATINALPAQTLSVTCSVKNPSSFHTGQSVVWVAYATGGEGNYRYDWSGSENLTGTNSTASIIYANEGQKNATVRVTSGSQSVTQVCTPLDTQMQPLIGWCGVSMSPSGSGRYNLSFSANTVGSTGTTTSYQWSGIETTSSTNFSQVSGQYSSLGVKTGNVLIQSGGQSLGLTCSADVHSNLSFDNNYNPLMSGGCMPSVNGMTVTWSAVGGGGSTTTPTFEWSGSDGFATTTQHSLTTYTYTTEGTKSATLTVRSGPEYITFMCQARVASTTDSGHCFIATAAFGTPLEKEVMVLRNFRDETLLRNPLGKIFVKAYYFLSPPIADFIRHRESLKFLVRLELRPIIFILQHAGYKDAVVATR